MIFLGVDPGLSGGIGILTQSGKIMLAESMPVMPSPVKGKRMVDAHKLAELLRNREVAGARTMVERVNAMPAQGVSSTFSFGQSYGIVLGVLAGLGLGYELVLPQTWKKAYNLGSDKAQALGLVQRRWPELHLKKSDDGIAEALLMADWLRTH